MRNHVILASILALAACSEPVPCRYKVGDRVKLLTGDTYMVMEAFNGLKDSSINGGDYQPRYKLATKGMVWNLSFGGRGATLSNVYWAKESEIAGFAEGAK